MTSTIDESITQNRVYVNELTFDNEKQLKTDNSKEGEEKKLKTVGTKFTEFIKNNNKKGAHVVVVYDVDEELPEVQIAENNTNEQNDDLDDIEIEDNNLIVKIRQKVYDITETKIFKWFIRIVLFASFLTFFILAMYLNNPFKFPSNMTTKEIIENHIFTNNPTFGFFVITCIVSLLLLWDKIIVKQNQNIKILLKKLNINIDLPKLKVPYFEWVQTIVLLILCFVYLFLTISDYYNFVSLLGIIAFVLFSAFLSVRPAQINWKNLLMGLILQFCIGVFVLRIYFGYRLFKFFGDRVETFLRFADFGSRLVFGPSYTDHFVVFAAVPVGIFFSGITSLLYYYGIMQYVIIKTSWFLMKILHTSSSESMNAVCSIFLGQAESPVIIKPFLHLMTNSELFSIMTAGFSTVAGGVLAAFIAYGVPANHLLIASIMSAPAALTISKVIYPETKKCAVGWKEIKRLKEKNAINAFEAFSNGSVAMIGPLAAVIVNLIVFTAIFEFINAVTIWTFSLVNLENFGLDSLLQYPFLPIAFLMGAHIEDCSTVAKLVAKKIFVSEFVAYKDLGNTINFRNEILAANTYDLYRNHTLAVPKHINMIWNDRSLVISTYALCGFSNFAAIGICIGAMSALVPTKSRVISRLAVTAMIAGNVACFLTACVCGLLYDPNMRGFGKFNFNATSIYSNSQIA